MPQSIQITEASPLLHDANCVYCHVDLVLNDHAVVCKRCQSPHHHDCWRANGDQCATFGCSDVGPIVPENSTRPASRMTRRHSTPDFPRSQRQAGPRWIIFSGTAFYASIFIVLGALLGFEMVTITTIVFTVMTILLFTLIYLNR